MPMKKVPKKEVRKAVNRKAAPTKGKAHRKLTLIKGKKPVTRPAAKALIEQPEIPVAIYEVVETEIFADTEPIIDVEEEKEIAG